MIPSAEFLAGVTVGYILARARGRVLAAYYSIKRLFRFR